MASNCILVAFDGIEAAANAFRPAADGACAGLTSRVSARTTDVTVDISR